MGMLEHLDEEPLLKFMEEARRVLRPGGRFLAWTFSKWSPIVAMTHGPGWLIRLLPTFRFRLVGRSSDELCMLATAAGFQHARKPRLGGFFPFSSAVIAYRT